MSDQRASTLVRGEMFCAELRSRWSKTAERKNGVCSLRDRRRIGEQAERGFRCGQSERGHRARRAIGATGAQHRLHSRHTPWFVARLGSELLSSATTEPDQPLQEVLAGAITRVADLHGHTCDLDDPGTPASSVTIVREGDQGLDYLVLFDSVIVLDGPSDLKVVTDPAGTGLLGPSRRRRMRRWPGRCRDPSSPGPPFSATVSLAWWTAMEPVTGAG